MTASFSRLLIAWTIPSCLALVLDDDYYNDGDDHQNQAKQDELAPMNDACNPIDHLDLNHIVSTHGKNEQSMWEAGAAEARIKGPKDFAAAVSAMTASQAPLGTNGSACQCCFKHPIVVKMGARFVQHMFPDMAQNISVHLENITQELRNHPDHTIDLMMNNLRKGKASRARSLARTGTEKGLTSYPSPCMIDGAQVIVTVGMLILPAIGETVLPESLAKNFAGATSGPEKNMLEQAATAVFNVIVEFVTGGGAWALAKSGFALMNIAHKVYALIKGVVMWLSNLFTTAVSQYKSTLWWWDAAIAAVKIMAQFAVWFLSGGLALIATIVAGIVDMLTLGEKMINTDKCFPMTGTKWKFW